MRNYKSLLVFAPTTDICYDNWQESINKRCFSCGPLKALEELKKICPNIQTTTIEKLCDRFNRNRTLDFLHMKLNWFGVIYVEI